MSTQISIGALEAGESVPINLEGLPEARLLIAGNSGAGKSQTLRRLIEQTYGKIQQIIFDPEDEFFTLREKLDFVLTGSDDADFPTSPDSAVALAQKVIDLNLSIVLGMNELELEERYAFVAKFLHAIIHMPKAKRRPIMIVIDEADMYAPEGCEKATRGKTAAGDAGLEMVDLAIRGRKRGLCMVIATNRVAMVSTTVRAPCVNKLIGRQSLDIDIDRAAKDLGMSKTKDVLRFLEAGDFYAVGPMFGLQTNVEKIHVGDVITTHPKPGSSVPAAPPPRAQVAKILAELASLSESDEPAEPSRDCTACPSLRIERDRLKGQLEAMEDDSRREALRSWKLGFNACKDYVAALDAGDVIERALMDELPDDVRALPSTLRADLDAVDYTRPPAKLANKEPQRAVDHAKAKPVEIVRPATGSAMAERLSEMERTMLIAVAQHRDGLTKGQVLLIAGYASSGHASKAFASIERQGLVSRNDNRLVITAIGRGVLGPDYKPLPTGKALLKHLIEGNKLTEMERAMLQCVASVNPQPIAKGRVLIETGYSSSGHASKAFAKLTRMNWLTKSGSMLALSQDLR